MARGTVTFTWNPDPIVFARSIEAVRLAQQDRSRPLFVASEVMQSDIAERFHTETDPEGVAWPRLSFLYDRFIPGMPILQQTRALYHAATSSEATVITKDTVFYRTDLLPHYGLAHDEGLPSRRPPLPQREFLGMSDEAQLIVFGEFADWFDSTIDLYITARGRIGRRFAKQGPGGFVPR